VAGDAAVFVDPKNVDDIAKGIGRVLDDTALRETLIAKGTDRVKAFSWDTAAQKTKDALLS
jgi:alpha-1,3-rhamnosyl/mannosyltransferase